MSIPKPRRTRPETDSEHLVRDMREGRFPRKSPRQERPEEQDMSDAIGAVGLWAGAHDRLQARVPGAAVFKPERHAPTLSRLAGMEDLLNEHERNELTELRQRVELLLGFCRWVASMREKDDLDSLDDICDAADRALNGDKSIVAREER